MKTPMLTSSQRAALRARAHDLHPLVMIGQGGLTTAVIKETDAALKAHELIKVRVLGDDRAARLQIFEKLCEALQATPIQHIGKLLILFRQQPEERVVREPSADKKPGPRTVKVVKPSKSGKRRPVTKKITVLGNQRVTAGGNLKKARPRQRSVKKSVGD